MAQTAPRVDLSDSGAEYYCLSCGGRYRLKADGCASCAAEVLASREEILDHLRRSCSDPAAMEPEPEQLMPLPDSPEPAQPEAILDVLRTRGIPFLRIGERGQLLELTDNASATLLVPERFVQELPDELPHPYEDTVALASFSSVHEGEFAQALLDEAGISFELRRMPAQFGFSGGALGVVEIHVVESDLERARIAIGAAGGKLEERGRRRQEPVVDDDGMSRARIERRFMIARLFLYFNGLVFLLMSVIALGASPVDMGANVAIGALLFSLARASVRAPRKAFFWSAVVVAGTIAWAIFVDRPFLFAPGLLCLLAVYFAHRAAAEAEPAD